MTYLLKRIADKRNLSSVLISFALGPGAQVRKGVSFDMITFSGIHIAMERLTEILEVFARLVSIFVAPDLHWTLNFKIV